MRLVALDELAGLTGLRQGQGVAEARAICPTLDVVEADAAADLRFLEALADWCDRYTPLVALDGQDGLLLDISGCAHLFGGEKRLVDDLLDRLLHLGLDARVAVSSAPGLSWAAARFCGPVIVTEAEAEPVLAAMPVAALRIGPDTVAALYKVGLKRIGDILLAPRAPLARRFGARLLLRLDQALGLEGEPISPRRPVAELSAERRLAEPIASEEAILHLAGQLAASLKSALEARGQGGRLFELSLFRVDGRVFRIRIGAAVPLRDAKRIESLFCERLKSLRDDLDAGYGFELLRLNVLEAEALVMEQAGFAHAARNDTLLAGFVDQVTARLGPDCLSLPMTTQSHWPERESILVPAVDGIARISAPTGQDAAAVPVRGERPLRLFRHPEQVEVMADVPDGPPASFRWRRTQHRVLRSEGPERLAGEWWIDGEEAPARDYFRIEDQIGHRFWLFREGLYERGATLPRWFMHGVFA